MPKVLQGIERVTHTVSCEQLEAQTMGWFFDRYTVRCGRTDWRFVPLKAPDLQGVAPAALRLGECDPLVDKGLACADRLRCAGVHLELELAPGGVHDFIKMGRVLRELHQAHQAQEGRAQVVRAAWAPPTP